MPDISRKTVEAEGEKPTEAREPAVVSIVEKRAEKGELTAQDVVVLAIPEEQRQTHIRNWEGTILYYFTEAKAAQINQVLEKSRHAMALLEYPDEIPPRPDDTKDSHWFELQVVAEVESKMKLESEGAGEEGAVAAVLAGKSEAPKAALGAHKREAERKGGGDIITKFDRAIRAFMRKGLKAAAALEEFYIRLHAHHQKVVFGLRGAPDEKSVVERKAA